MTIVSEPLTVMFDLSAAGVGVEPAPGADLFSSLRVQPRATTAEIAKTARGRMLMVGTSVGWSLGLRRDRLVTIRRRMGNGATMRAVALDRAPPGTPSHERAQGKRATFRRRHFGGGIVGETRRGS